MKKHIRKLIALTMAVVMAFAMGGCSLQAEADEVFSGELVDAQNSRLVVKSTDKTMLFTSNEKTEYDLGDEDHICVGDKIEVTFHKQSDVYVADSVKVTEHKDDTLVFGGQVMELEKHYITIRSESLTAGFDYDEETMIDGNLSKGDAVTVTYKGDISERPYAISIVVIEEKREEALKSLHGTVAEATKTSVLVSMDSADAARFQVTPDTIINGDDTKLQAGDEVNLVYTGTIGNDPVARSITITRNKEQTYFVMDGVIETVAEDSLTIKTMNKLYKFKVTKDTRIQNKKYMEKDHKCTMTYTGDIHDNPTAVSIYCSKSKMTKKEKKSETTKKTTTTTKKTTTTTKKTTKKTTKHSETKTKPTETKTKPTETKTKPTETKTKPTETKTEPTETKTEPTETKTEPTEPTTEPPTEPTTEPPTEPTTEPPTETTTEAPTEPPEPEPVTVKATGVITSWGNPCTIKLDGGGTVTLGISNSTISGGYIPEVNDQVVLMYDKDSMELQDLQLTYRPTDDSAE